MASQLDLDQGGTFREWNNIYLGPSVGWVRAPVRSQLLIIAGGIYILDLSTTYVEVFVNAPVTIILPSLAKPVPAAVTPGKFVLSPVTIVDAAGFAAGNPITIQSASITETIMGLNQIQITSNFGGFILYATGGKWTNQS